MWSWIQAPQIWWGIFVLIDVGYLNSPETTAASLDSNGWLHTGDLGYVDTNGYLFIVDRLKEMIKYNAHQVCRLHNFISTPPSIPTIQRDYDKNRQYQGTKIINIHLPKTTE